MLAQDIPVGRIAEVKRTSVDMESGYLYIMRLGKILIKLWPKASTGNAHAELLQERYMNWEVELLPETTTITFAMNGDDWEGKR